jgi:glycosyltransferase involved in cell wall biosynthesis
MATLYHKGFASARGRYLVMGDADDTYDFTMIPQFLAALESGEHQFVTGTRYLGGGDAEITALHRYFGNPALTRILNLLFGTRYTDVYCGFRAFSRDTYDAIRPVSPGMEFNLELAINAGLAGLQVKEIPIVLAPRKGESKLRTFRDGWRSLRMMLLYSPNKLFLAPGAALLGLGLVIHVAVLLVWCASADGRLRRDRHVRDHLQRRRIRDLVWASRQDLLVEPPV